MSPSTAVSYTHLDVYKRQLDDIDIAEFKEIPTYKRMCICILKNDHVCKYIDVYKRQRLYNSMQIYVQRSIF